MKVTVNTSLDQVNLEQDVLEPPDLLYRAYKALRRGPGGYMAAMEGRSNSLTGRSFDYPGSDNFIDSLNWMIAIENNQKARESKQLHLVIETSPVSLWDRWHKRRKGSQPVTIEELQRIVEYFE